MATTKEFIKKNYNVPSTRERRCSSVFADNKGNIYSYGWHYPLLFEVDGLNFINTMGYSNTTARHISWAWSAMDYSGVIPVDLPRGTSARVTLAEIKDILTKQLKEVTDEMVAKKRKDTSVYGYLIYRAERISKSLTQVQESV